MSEPTENKQERRESVKLDEIMRLLFDMSKETLVNMLNGLFGETFDPELVDITKDSTKFVNEQLEIIEGDLFLRVFEPKEISKPHLFHIEFQTNEDRAMAIRVLRYDISKAAENQLLSGNKDEFILYMPQSLVIHIEAHESIPNEYKAVIVFADGDTKRFTVPVLKYWELSEADLIERNLFPLLPLQIFLLRAELDKLTKNNDEQSKHAAILRAFDIAKSIAEEAAGLNKAGRLLDEDYKRVLSAIEYLFRYLNKRYVGDTKLNEGVYDMLKVLDFKGAQTAARETQSEIATKAIKKGLSLEDVAELTGLDIEIIKELQEADANSE